MLDSISTSKQSIDVKSDDYPVKGVDKYSLSSIDRKLIVLTQEGLPIAPRPYHVLALMLDISPDEVMTRLQRMLDQGIIRRIAAVPNHYKLGFKTTGETELDGSDEKVGVLV